MLDSLAFLLRLLAAPIRPTSIARTITANSTGSPSCTRRREPCSPGLAHTGARPCLRRGTRSRLRQGQDHRATHHRPDACDGDDGDDPGDLVEPLDTTGGSR